jgi:uncharacterized SAM-binding protein YcdF (DUF218 family)
MLKYIVSWCIEPMNIFWLLIALFFASRIRKSNYSNFYLYAALVWIWLTSTRCVTDSLVVNLEKRYQVLSKIHGDIDTTLILVLGGGNFTDISIPPQERLVASAKARLMEGIRLLNTNRKSKLVLSGYGGTGEISQAEAYKSAALLYNVDANRIALLDKSRTTQEEAYYCKKIFGSKTKLVLVTSDIHMPRSMYLFRKIGLMPIAAPSDHILKMNDDWVKGSRDGISFFEYFTVPKWVSDVANQRKFSSALHEYIGLLWAKSS